MSEHIVMKQAKDSESDFLVYTGNFCGYCTAAKRLLTAKRITFDEINFDHEDPDLRNQVVGLTGHRTVPVIFDNREETLIFVGGFDELSRYLKS
ncbi:MAG: glutaredoxin [Euryarchaeota archaeon]|nr:glutaredoxin [Euryarchaeota archaeon]|tara:strand:+ start:184 stop:465 length:282 start_codon:yes stop_codon:yes gene_type:complete